jgi:hypothetical protein
MVTKSPGLDPYPASGIRESGSATRLVIQDQKREPGQGEGGGSRAEEEGGAEAEAHGEGESVQTGEETEEENGGQVPGISNISCLLRSFGCSLKNLDPVEVVFTL